MEGDSAVEKEVKRHVTQILCVLCAIALWLYVTYTEDPEMQVWMRNIPVSYTGADELAARGITFVQREETAQINVKVSGRRSLLHRLQDSDLRAQVDYSGIEDAGLQTLPIHVTLLQNDLRITKLSVSEVSCRTDLLVTVDKTISVTSSGAEELGIHDFAVSPSTVRITGPKSTLEHLKAGVYVDLTKEDVGDTQHVTLSDQFGEPVSADLVNMESDAVTLSATRSLPVVLEAANTPETGKIKEVICTPKTADVRGSLSTLLSLESVPGSYSVWVNYASSPAQSGQVPLSYPEDVEVLGPAYASAEFHIEY